MQDCTTPVPRHPRRSTERARLAGLTSTLGPDHPRVREARQAYTALYLDDVLTEVLPDLAPDRVEHFAIRLRRYADGTTAVAS